MKEFWMILGLFVCFVNSPKTLAFGMTHSPLRKNSSNVHDNLSTSGTVKSPLLNLTQWSSTTASLLQESNGQSKTIITSNNKVNGSSTTVKTEPFLAVLSTLFVVQTRTSEIVNSALSTNEPPENLATKHSSLNIQNDFFSGKEHISAISPGPSVITPEISPTASKFNGIISPSSSVDKKYLSTSQAGDTNSNGYISQGAFTKSALSDENRKGLTSQASGQFSSWNSILGQISSYYDTAKSANDGSRLFTKGSTSLTKLPRTFLFSLQTIWKTTQLNPLTDHETTFLFSDKSDTSLSHATQTSDGEISTAVKTRKLSSISRMSQATLAAEMTRVESDFASATFAPSRATQMATTSVVHSAIQREFSLVSTVVMASPSVSSKNRKISSQSSSATTKISTTPMIQLTASRNSKFSSRPENGFPILTRSDKEGSSSRMSSNIIRSSKDSASNSVSNNNASISLDQTTISVPQGAIRSSQASTLVEQTPSLAVADLETHSLPSQTTKVNSTKHFLARTSLNVELSSHVTENPSSLSPEKFSALKTGTFHQTWISESSSVIGGNEIRFSSTQSSDMTRELAASSVPYSAVTASYNGSLMARSTISDIGHQFHLSSPSSGVSTDQVPTLSSHPANTSAFSSSQMISHSQILQEKSSIVSKHQNFSPSLISTVTTLLDQSKLQTVSLAVSASSSRTELTSEIIVPLPEESVTSYKAESTQLSTTVQPTKTMPSSPTVIANISTGSPTTVVADSSHIKLLVTSSVAHSAIQKDISLVSSIVMASPSVSSKTRKISLHFSTTTLPISTTPMIQQPVTSEIVSQVSSIPENNLHTLTSSFTEEHYGRNMSSTKVLSSRENASRYVTIDSVSLSLQETTTSLPKGLSTSVTTRKSASISEMLQASSVARMSQDENEFASTTFPPSHATQMVTSSVENLSFPFLSSTNAKTMTKWLTQSTVQATDWTPLSASEKFSALNTDSYHQTPISRSSSVQSSDMTSKLVASSAPYSKSSSQTPHTRSSASTAVSSRSIPQKTSSANFGPSLSSTMTTLIDQSKLQTSSSAVSASPSRTEFTSEIIVPVPGESVTSTGESAKLSTTVNPTQTSSSSATVIGNIATGPPTTVATDSGHIKLLIVVAIIPSVILCVFFGAVLLIRRRRNRRNKAVYSIKLEYADENNGFRKRCVNSRLDLSLKGIHIDLEFPNMPSDRERRASYGRDSPRYSRGSNLSETQMRELQILSQECKENMEWISEVIAREMEASICGRTQPNRESVYSVKEKENYEPSEKGIIRRESSKRGRETVKWRVPVVQRCDSEEFDQRDSMCTDDTTLFPEDWKDGHQKTERSISRNGAETQRKNNQKPNLPVEKNGEKSNLDKELRVQLSNKKLEELQSKDNDKKEKELAENIPLTVNLNSKKDDTPHVTQGKRSSARPRRFETL
ncbi:hypothetical protein ACROYT_G032493 [Oculina patagonica]